MPAGRNLNTYVVLLRGINVGGQNKVPMKALVTCLQELGFSKVSTYIASGNVILESKKKPEAVKAEIEKALPKRFKLDSDLIKVLVVPRSQLQRVVESKPQRFGDQPDKYHSDVIFLMDLDIKHALEAFDPREGVDQLWPGHGVIYHQRLSAQRTKTRLNKMMGRPAYKSMTIRTWTTTTKLLELMGKLSS